MIMPVWTAKALTGNQNASIGIRISSGAGLPKHLQSSR